MDGALEDEGPGAAAPFARPHGRCCFCLYGHLSCYGSFSPPPLLLWWVLWMCIIQHFLYLFSSSLLCS
jgi:hypothetical protein